jgi:hypothetical protein
MIVTSKEKNSFDFFSLGFIQNWASSSEIIYLRFYAYTPDFFCERLGTAMEMREKCNTNTSLNGMLPSVSDGGNFDNEAEFLNVFGIKVCTVASTNEFYSPPPSHE